MLREPYFRRGMALFYLNYVYLQGKNYMTIIEPYHVKYFTYKLICCKKADGY